MPTHAHIATAVMSPPPGIPAKFFGATVADNNGHDPSDCAKVSEIHHVLLGQCDSFASNVTIRGMLQRASEKFSVLSAPLSRSNCLTPKSVGTGDA